MTTQPDLFATASRLKFRFPTPKGLLNTEQLWDLPLTSDRAETVTLDNVARAVNADLKATAEESFVPTGKVSKAQAELAQKLELVKHIIAVRVEERDAASKARETAERKRKILDLIAQKDDEALAGKSKEDLLKELAELG